MFIGTLKNRNPFLLILSLSILSAFVGISSAETLISGTISTDTTWDLAGSPYVILDGGITVANGITLTSDNKIVFTSIKDGSYGGVGYPVVYVEVKV